MSLLKKLSTLGIALVFVLGFAGTTTIFAQDANEGEGGSGLLLSPTRTEITAQPGESKKLSVSLRNVTQGDLDVQVTLNDFTSDNFSGSPKIIIDENQEATPYSLKKMITDLESITLKADETKQVEHVVNVPTDVAPGAYFGAIRYSAIPVNRENSTGEKEVSLTASVAHLVFVEVPGDVVQQIRIEGLEAQDDKGKKSSIFSKPSKSALTVKNLGNGFSKPFGKVTLTKGSKIVGSYEINNSDTKSIVLPQSSRVFTDDLKGVSAPGKYKLTAGIAYGNGGEVVQFESTFWYLPLWFVALLALILIVIVVGGYYAYTKATGKKFIKTKKNSKK